MVLYLSIKLMCILFDINTLKKNLQKFSILYWKLLTHMYNGKFSILIYVLLFPYRRIEIRECIENFQTQKKNFYMCMGHFKVWKKSHILSFGIFTSIFYRVNFTRAEISVWHRLGPDIWRMVFRRSLYLFPFSLNGP